MVKVMVQKARDRNATLARRASDLTTADFDSKWIGKQRSRTRRTRDYPMLQVAVYDRTGVDNMIEPPSAANP